MLNMTRTIGFNCGARALVTLQGDRSVTFAGDLTIGEAKWVIIELLKHGGLIDDDVVTFANDLARKTLELPPDCDALQPPTFEQRHAANEEARREIRDFLGGNG